MAIAVKVDPEWDGLRETIREGVKLALITYSEWLDTNHLLTQTAEYPADLTHEELVSEFLARND